MRSLLLGIFLSLSALSIAQNSPNDSLHIYVFNQLIAKTPLKADLNNFPEDFIFLSADSIRYFQHTYYIYYNALFEPDSVIFVSTRKIPRILNRYYNSRPKIFTGYSPSYAEDLLKKDFIDVKQWVPVIENGRKILYIRGEYHPASFLQANLSLSSNNNQIHLLGEGKLILNHVFTGSDHLSVSYFSAGTIQVAGLHYSVKYFPYDISAGLHLSQYKQDSLLRNTLSFLVQKNAKFFSLLTGYYHLNSTEASRNAWIMGFSTEYTRQRWRWNAGFRTFFSNEGLLKWNWRLKWVLLTNPGIKLKWIMEKTKEAGLTDRSAYTDFFTGKFFAGHKELKAFFDSEIKLYYEKKSFIFYGYVRHFSDFSTDFLSKQGFIEGIGIGFHQKNSFFSMEWAFVGKNSYLTVNQPFVILFKQEYNW